MESQRDDVIARILTHFFSSIPDYWAQQLRPSDTREAMHLVDARINQSLELIAEAACSPCDRNWNARQATPQW